MAPHPSPPTSLSDWVDLAKSRILRILRLRIAANIRQLEVKISESGPVRPQPHIVGIALQELLQSKLVSRLSPQGESKAEETRFYALSQMPKSRVNARMEVLLRDYRIFRLLTDKREYCADVLEGIVRASFNAAQTKPPYTYLGKLPTNTPLDGVYEVASMQVGVEVKNIREWVYPHSRAVWEMIRKCLEVNAVPFLIAREVAHFTRAKMSAYGLVSFSFHRQVFAPLVAEYLKNIQHKDLLGYKDVIAMDPNTAHPALRTFIESKLLTQLQRARVFWNARLSILEDFAVTRGLGDRNVSTNVRDKIYRQFADLVPPPLP